jgi:hypothetical protein
MCIAVVCAGCANAPSPQVTSAATHRARPGSVESIEQVEEEQESENPVEDAFIILLTGGLLFGNLVFHHGTERVVGAGDGTRPRIEPDGDSSTLPRYRVIIRFDDGDSMTLEYLGDVPFDRDERVVLTDHGLVRTRSFATSSLLSRR